MHKRSLVLAVAFALVGLAGSANAQTVINADVTSNTTWSGTVVLQKPIFVKNGAILTILPGTIVRGQPRSGAVVPGSTVGTPGALIVTQSGRIVANGTATNPIVMTTAAVDNNSDGIPDDDDSNGFEDSWVAGDLFLDSAPLTAPLAPLDAAGNSTVALWGGLVLLGNAPNNLANKCGISYGKCTIEGLTIPGFPVADATYGGIEPHDNSGSLRYVSVRHAGDEIGAGNELNGVSFGSVGDGTVIDHVEVYVNFDDAFEFFGGTVSPRYLVAEFVGDDNFDIDQGYVGTIQFGMAISPFFNENDAQAFGSASGDKLCEFDGDDVKTDDPAFTNNANIRLDVTQSVVNVTQFPFANPYLWNLTLLGNTVPGVVNPAVSPASANPGCQYRQGFGGAVLNSIIMNTSGPGITIDTDAGEAVPGFDAFNNIDNGYSYMACTTLKDTGAIVAASYEEKALNNGNAVETALGVTTGANSINSASFNGLVNSNTYFLPTGVAGKLAPGLVAAKIDPRPKSGLVGLAGCAAPQAPGADASATYRGAFNRTAPTLWTTGWTVLNLAGMLAN